MQSQRSERSREVFQEQTHHYHTSITSHPHRLTEQVSGNPQPWAGQQCEAPLLASLESVQAMSEEATSTFTRGSRTRASLPVVKSSNQTKDRSLGVLFLQYGDETRQILMPNELTSADTVRALFVSAFPQQLTLKMLESPSVAVYIKDHVRNVYYELTDIRNITAHSCLKVYHKDPAQAFNHSPLNGTADTRLPRYSARQQAGGQNMLHTLPPPHSPVRGLKGSLSPPSGRSVPPSPSRFPYGMALPAGATLPRERQSSVPGTRSAPPCTSAILERRDVKPDEDLGGRAAPLYADPYALAEARLSVASSQGTHASDAPDGQVFLQRRPHAKSLGSYAEVSEPQHSLYRQRSRKYSENPHVPLGSKTPPSSPQRVGEVRMIDVHPSQNAHMLAQGAERSLHARRSFRKDSNGTLEVVGRMRGTVASPVFVDLPHGHADRPFQGIIATAGPQGERMKAMEQQIASLTGLVQHALFKGTNTSGVKENGSEKVSEPLALGTTSGGVSPMAGSKSPVLQAHPLARAFPPGSGDPALGPLLCTFKRNVSNLRMELQQLRQTQVQNQEVVREMLQQTEVVLTERVGEQLRLLDDPVQKQRKQVEQERHRYVSMEEKLLLQLGELENHVERLKNDSAQQPIALRDVEEGAVTLRTVGETLAALKGEFPALQLKMRSVLRVEVEAVRFLKEEPHKMDATLKRVKALTDTLSSLRRCASEGHAFVDLPAPVNLTPAKESDPPDVWRDSPSPQPSTPARTELKPSSPVVVHQACSSPVSLQPSQQSVGLSLHPSPPLSPSSSEDSAALQENKGPAVQERVKSRGSLTSGLRRHDEIRSGKSEERVERAEEDVGAQMERKLRQAQTRLMESIPDLEVTQEESSSPPPATCLPDQANPSQPSPPLPDAATLAEPVADKPVQISAERGPNTHVEKPHLVKSSPETAIKSPPPPPPRRLHPSAPGVTTGRSGEVIYTARKEPPPVQQQEGEEEAPHAKPQRVPPEVKPKPHISPPVNTSSARGEDQGDRDRIAPDLQVFEKCPVKDLEPRYVVDLTTHELPDKELETNFSFSSFDPKNAPQHCSDGPQSPKTPKPGSGVIYYITGKSRSPSDTAPSGPGEQNHPSEGIISSLKVAVLNPSDPSPWPNVLTSHDLTLDSPTIEEKQEETPDTDTSVILTEALKDGCGAGDDPEDDSSERVTDRLEDAITDTEVPPCVRGEDQTGSQARPEPPEMSSENGRQGEDQNTEKDQNTEENQAEPSPDLLRETGSPENFAFVITKTKVQALSTGEYQQLVNSKGQDVETVRVGTDTANSSSEDGRCGKKPVIIVFEEPMDIQQAYKRLSTIFECEEELERMISEQRIDEEEEEEESPSQATEVDQHRLERNPDARGDGEHLPAPGEKNAEDGSKVEQLNDVKQEGKKKFKFPFPKKQLAAIGQALRTGSKAGKKTLQVVVYEDQEEADGTLKRATEAKRFEISSTTYSAGSAPAAPPPANAGSQSHVFSPQSPTRTTNEICKSTYKTLDSLEETIKQLETTISDMEPALSPETSRKSLESKTTTVETAQCEGNPSARPAPLGPKPQKPPQRKKSKALSVLPLPPTSPSSATSKQNPSGASSLSRITSPKSRAQAGTVEKPAKPPKLQDSQRQFRQVVLL
ncbi:sickle tail protein isoform X2 [Brachyhypopomus gauderio]